MGSRNHILARDCGYVFVGAQTRLVWSTLQVVPILHRSRERRSSAGMCRNCAERDLKPIYSAERAAGLCEGPIRVCVAAHGDHSHIRFRTPSGESSAWHHINAELAELLDVIPRLLGESTEVHVHDDWTVDEDEIAGGPLDQETLAALNATQSNPFSLHAAFPPQTEELATLAALQTTAIAAQREEAQELLEAMQISATLAQTGNAQALEEGIDVALAHSLGEQLPFFEQPFHELRHEEPRHGARGGSTSNSWRPWPGNVSGGSPWDATKAWLALQDKHAGPRARRKEKKGEQCAICLEQLEAPDRFFEDDTCVFVRMNACMHTHRVRCISIQRT